LAATWVGLDVFVLNDAVMKRSEPCCAYHW
jgi:hypothetical protein